MTAVHDPTAYEIHFFALPGARGEGKLAHLQQFLVDAVGGFARARNLEPPAILWPRFLIDVSRRLASVGPVIVSPNRSQELDLWTMHDTAMLRTIDERVGGFSAEDVAGFDRSSLLPTSDKQQATYLGAFRVWYFETERAETEWIALGEELANQCGWPWLAEYAPLQTPIGTLRFGTPPGAEDAAPALDLLFIGGRDAAAVARGYSPHPFLTTLPELALCHLKVRNAAGNLRSRRLNSLTNRDTELRTLLRPEVVPPHPHAAGQATLPTHLDMLAHNDKITTGQATLVDAVVDAREEIRTLRTNGDVFAGVVADAPFADRAAGLRHLLIDRWTHGPVLQAENEIGYAEGTLYRARTHFESIEATAEAKQARGIEKQARGLRRLNFWVILIGALQLAFMLLIGSAQIYLAYKSLPSPPAQPAKPAAP